MVKQGTKWFKMGFVRQFRNNKNLGQTLILCGFSALFSVSVLYVIFIYYKPRQLYTVVYLFPLFMRFVAFYQILLPQFLPQLEHFLFLFLLYKYTHKIRGSTIIVSTSKIYTLKFTYCQRQLLFYCQYAFLNIFPNHLPE